MTRTGVTCLEASAAVLGAALVSACARSPADVTISREPPSTQASSSPSQAAPLDTHVRGWEAGQWYAYELTMGTRVAVGDLAAPIAFDLSGTLRIATASLSPDGVTLYAAIENPKIATKTAKGQPELDKVADQIRSTGCFFTLAGGRVKEMLVPNGLPPTPANIYRQVGAALQVARSSGDTPHYTAEESDTTGNYVAQYDHDGDSSVWHKHKIRYTSILAAKSMPAGVPGHVIPQVVGSRADILLFPDGRLRELDDHEEIFLNSAQAPIRSETSVGLKAIVSAPVTKTGPSWETLMAGMQHVAADEPLGGQAALEAVDDARIGTFTFDAALAELERLAKDRGQPVISSVNGAAIDSTVEEGRRRRTADESRAFIAISAIMREHPETVAVAVRKIRAKSPAADLLVSALGAASTPAAQRALVDLLNAKTTDATLRTQILTSMSRTSRPAPASIEAMKALLKTDPFSEQALLALGTFSRRLRDAGDGVAAAQLGEIVLSALKAASNKSDLLTGLRAIMNSGWADGMPTVLTHIKDDEPVVRAAAVRALQSMHEARVDDVIADTLGSDPESDVRIAALSAAKVREPTAVLMLAVQSAATTAADPRVRYRAVELLGAWLPSRPDLQSALEQIAHTDDQLRVRERAETALAPTGG